MKTMKGVQHLCIVSEHSQMDMRIIGHKMKKPCDPCNNKCISFIIFLWI